MVGLNAPQSRLLAGMQQNICNRSCQLCTADDNKWEMGDNLCQIDDNERDDLLNASVIDQIVVETRSCYTRRHYGQKMAPLDIYVSVR